MPPLRGQRRATAVRSKGGIRHPDTECAFLLDMLGLKAALLVEGVTAEPEALAGLGQLYKEQNHGLFGWDFEDHVDQLLPDDFRLPDGTVVQFRKNSGSPYEVRSLEGSLLLFHVDEPICEVAWLERPAFYRAHTSSGDPMIKIGQIGGEDCLFFCYQNFCSHFSDGQQCLFCNLVSTSKTYDSVHRRKDIESIGEVARTAWAEGMVDHILLTGGCFGRERETNLVTQIVSSIRKHTGLDRVPGTILPSPAQGDDIKRYYESGIQAIGYSMEIWDPKLYEGICPGKSATTSHDEFVRSISEAVRVFGEGNVYGAFVMGLEPQDTILEGIRVLTKIGANIVPFVWSPNPGSRLAGHRAPSAEWYVDTCRRAAEIVHQSGVPAGTENHCYRCDGNSLLHDALRANGVV